MSALIPIPSHSDTNSVVTDLCEIENIIEVYTEYNTNAWTGKASECQRTGYDNTTTNIRTSVLTCQEVRKEGNKKRNNCELKQNANDSRRPEGLLYGAGRLACSRGTHTSSLIIVVLHRRSNTEERKMPA